MVPLLYYYEKFASFASSNAKMFLFEKLFMPNLYFHKSLTVFTGWPIMISCVCYSDCLDGIVVNIYVQTYQALARNLIIKFMVKLKKSTNVIIKGLVCPSVSDVIYRSNIWTHWYRLLYVHFDKS